MEFVTVHDAGYSTLKSLLEKYKNLIFVTSSGSAGGGEVFTAMAEVIVVVTTVVARTAGDVITEVAAVAETDGTGVG